MPLAKLCRSHCALCGGGVCSSSHETQWTANTIPQRRPERGSRQNVTLSIMTYALPYSVRKSLFFFLYPSTVSINVATATGGVLLILSTDSASTTQTSPVWNFSSSSDRQFDR